MCVNVLSVSVRLALFSRARSSFKSQNDYFRRCFCCYSFPLSSKRSNISLNEMHHGIPAGSSVFFSVYEECFTSLSDGVTTSVQLFERYKDHMILRVTTSQEVS